MGKLLVILLAEVRDSQAATELSSLRTTVATPRKCPGRLAPHKPSARPSDLDGHRGRPRVHFRNGRYERHVHAVALADNQVGIDISGIAAQVVLAVSNWSGLTKIVATTRSHSPRARSNMAVWAA